MRMLQFIICLALLAKTYLQQKCFKAQPSGSYCPSTGKCSYCTNTTCLTCLSDLQTCLTCSSSKYLFQGNCYTSIPEGAKCDSNKVCQPCSVSNCADCSSDVNVCNYCNQQSSYKYLYKNECLTDPPKYGECNSKNVCTFCCQVLYNTTITKEQVSQLSESTSAASQSSFIASTVTSSSTSALGHTSSGMVIAGLTSQKLTYMILQDINIPPLVFQTLKSAQQQLPSKQVKELNFFPEMTKMSTIEYNRFLSVEFETVSLYFSILLNCGQGVSLFLICGSLFGIFYIIMTKLPKIKGVGQFLFAKIVCGYLIQYFQLIVSMSLVGINTQILEFTNANTVEQLPLKIVSTFILVCLTALIFQQLYFYNNHSEEQKGNSSFAEITREKIMNETIFTNKLSRNYMLLFLIFESGIFPTIFIQLHGYPIVACSVALLFQIMFLIFTIKLMPFHSKLSNCYFILYSAVWVVFYLLYFILVIYCSKNDIEEVSSSLDNLSFILVILVQIILFSNPVYMILQMIVLIKELIIKMKKDKEEREWKKLFDQQQLLQKTQSMIVYKLHIKDKKFKRNMIEMADTPNNIQTTLYQQLTTVQSEKFKRKD